MVVSLVTMPSKAQINIDTFTANLIERSNILQKRKHSDVKKFMKCAYAKYPKLKDSSLDVIPIYSIYSKKRFVNKKMNKDSLLVYLNLNRLSIETVMFGKNNVLYDVASPKYVNFNDQPVGKGNDIENLLYKYIIDYKPDMVCSFADSSREFLLQKGGKIFCLIYDKIKKDFIPKKLSEFIEELDDDDFWYYNTEPSPPIYSR